MENRFLPLKILWLQVPDELTCFICRRPPMLWLKLPPASSTHFIDLRQHHKIYYIKSLGQGSFRDNPKQ